MNTPTPELTAHLAGARAALMARRDALNDSIALLTEMLGSSAPNGDAPPRPPIVKPQKTSPRAPIGQRISRAISKPARKLTANGDPGLVNDAIREVMRGMTKGATFTTPEMFQKIVERWPAMKQKAVNGIAMGLRYLIDKGELSQDRPGRGCTYTILAIKPPAGANVPDKEKQWNELRKEIAVPREAETE